MPKILKSVKIIQYYQQYSILFIRVLRGDVGERDDPGHHRPDQVGEGARGEGCLANLAGSSTQQGDGQAALMTPMERVHSSGLGAILGAQSHTRVVGRRGLHQFLCW